VRSDRLLRLLAQLPEGTRVAVCIDKATFRNNCEGDGVTILDVESVTLERVEMADDDGFADVRRDGTVRTRKCLVLRGAST
jgi:hypothetical protein